MLHVNTEKREEPEGGSCQGLEGDRGQRYSDQRSHRGVNIKTGAKAISIKDVGAIEAKAILSTAVLGKNSVVTKR